MTVEVPAAAPNGRPCDNPPMTRLPSFRLPLDSLACQLLHAARVVAAVAGGRSLADGLLDRVPSRARPAVQDIVYGTLRAYGVGDAQLDRLLARPLTDDEVRALLRVALYRLDTWGESPHTVVDQAVGAAGELAGGRCRGLVNAVLRNALRRRDDLAVALAADPVASTRHPAWWLAQLQAAYPEDWPAIVEADNRSPPMTLRVNTRRGGCEAYLKRLAIAGIEAWPVGEAAIRLAVPVAVDRLPGFDDGDVSVQDAGAQRAAELLNPAPGARVLDACAAPGGKTAHLLERCDLDLLALDLKPARCRRVEDTLRRLGLAATVQAADSARPDGWWDGQPFDAILADVPCSASGVVRRHPDAKWLRREADIAGFAAAQARLLDALWPLLRPGGRLLYATCSLFPAENGVQLQAFLGRTADARLIDEQQLIPGDDHDGFYYGRLQKAG